jgi:hypothetical protein
MALANGLLPGFTYTITSGALAGEEVVIVDNTPFPDTDATRRRKVTVQFSDGTQGYILPRQLSDMPVGQVPAFMPPASAAPVPTVVVGSWAPPTQPLSSLPAPPMPLKAPATLTVAAPGGVTVAVAGGRVLNPITDPMDPRLDHLRPNTGRGSNVSKYVNRIMANGQTDVEFFLTFASDAYRAENNAHPINCALKGETQAGKTLLVEVLAVEWAKMLGLPKPMPIFTLSGSSGVTDFDLFGQTTSYTDPATGIESLIWLPGIVELAAQCGGILYLDEMNAMGERVTSSLHPVIDHRHMFINRNKPVWKDGQFMPEVVYTSPDTWVIATYNEGYRGMGQMNEAYAQRFEHIVWEYDEAVERTLVKSPTILLLAQALRQARQSAMGIRTPFGTSAMQRFKRNVDTFGPEMAAQILCGMFPASERAVVESILTDRSIILLLQEEEKAAAAHAAALASSQDEPI